MAAWPGGLPTYLLTDGYVQAFGDGRIRSQTDTGPGKVRRRSTAMPEPIVGAMLMTTAQIATLRTFVQTTIFGGTVAFDFTDPITRATISVRFAERLPVITHRGGDIFHVMLELEKLP